MRTWVVQHRASNKLRIREPRVSQMSGFARWEECAWEVAEEAGREPPERDDHPAERRRILLRDADEVREDDAAIRVMTQVDELHGTKHEQWQMRGTSKEINVIEASPEKSVEGILRRMRVQLNSVGFIVGLRKVR